MTINRKKSTLIAVLAIVTLSVTSASSQDRAASRTADFYNHKTAHTCIGQVGVDYEVPEGWWYVDDCSFIPRSAAGKQILKVCPVGEGVCKVRAMVSGGYSDYNNRREYAVSRVPVFD